MKLYSENEIFHWLFNNNSNNNLHFLTIGYCMFVFSLRFRLLILTFYPGAGVSQLVSARPSELEVPGSIFGDSNACFDFLLICVALALNTRKTEHRQRKGVKCAPKATSLSVT